MAFVSAIVSLCASVCLCVYISVSFNECVCVCVCLCVCVYVRDPDFYFCETAALLTRDWSVCACIRAHRNDAPLIEWHAKLTHTHAARTDSQTCVNE